MATHTNKDGGNKSTAISSKVSILNIDFSSERYLENLPLRYTHIILKYKYVLQSRKLLAVYAN